MTGTRVDEAVARGPRTDSGYTAQVVAGAGGAVVFVVGLWLVIAPLVLVADLFSQFTRGRLVEVGVGMAVAVVGMVRALAPNQVVALDLLTAGAGGWLVVTALSGSDAADTAAAVNDVVCGLLLVTAAVMCAVAALRSRRDAPGPGTSEPEVSDAHPYSAGRAHDGRWGDPGTTPRPLP